MRKLCVRLCALWPSWYGILRLRRSVIDGRPCANSDYQAPSSKQRNCRPAGSGKSPKPSYITVFIILFFSEGVLGSIKIRTSFRELPPRFPCAVHENTLVRAPRTLHLDCAQLKNNQLSLARMTAYNHKDCPQSAALEATSRHEGERKALQRTSMYRGMWGVSLRRGLTIGSYGRKAAVRCGCELT